MEQKDITSVYVSVWPMLSSKFYSIWYYIYVFTLFCVYFVYVVLESVQILFF